MSNPSEKDLVTRALEDPQTRIEMEYEWFVDDVIVKIEQAMDKQKVSRAELAKRLNCSPANVTRLLRHGSNLTLKSLVDIALALEHRFKAPQLVPLTESAPWEVPTVTVEVSTVAGTVIMFNPHLVEGFEGSAFVSFAIPGMAGKTEAESMSYSCRQTGEFDAVLSQ